MSQNKKANVAIVVCRNVVLSCVCSTIAVRIT